jgi:hypothetical protein
MTEPGQVRIIERDRFNRGTILPTFTIKSQIVSNPRSLDPRNQSDKCLCYIHAMSSHDLRSDEGLRTASKAIGRLKVSIHAPVWGATAKEWWQHHYGKFQSTRPYGARHGRRRADH